MSDMETRARDAWEDSVREDDRKRAWFRRYSYQQPPDVWDDPEEYDDDFYGRAQGGPE